MGRWKPSVISEYKGGRKYRDTGVLNRGWTFTLVPYIFVQKNCFTFFTEVFVDGKVSRTGLKRKGRSSVHLDPWVRVDLETGYRRTGSNLPVQDDYYPKPFFRVSVKVEVSCLWMALNMFIVGFLRMYLRTQLDFLLFNPFI